jgi:hypothetical protein
MTRVVTIRIRGGKALPVTPTARALAATTGHPALKLTLLAVAVSPGWPTAADITTATELPADVAAAALAELVRVRLVAEHGGRYGLADTDCWGFTRADVDDPADAPSNAVAAAVERGEIGGYPMGRRGVAA